MGELTINGLVEIAYGTAKANGWHEDDGAVVASGEAQTQLAGLSALVIELGRVVEAIRKPDQAHPKARILDLEARARGLAGNGIADVSDYLAARRQELTRPLRGSQTQLIARLVLIISEAAEAIEAVELGDDVNLEEELADIMIRIGDFVGAANALQPGRFDLERAILAKNERNKARGHRHGGKLA